MLIPDLKMPKANFSPEVVFHDFGHTDRGIFRNYHFLPTFCPISGGAKGAHIADRIVHLDHSGIFHALPSLSIAFLFLRCVAFSFLPFKLISFLLPLPFR